MLVVGRELEVGGGLAIGQLVLRQRPRFFLFLRLLLFLRLDSCVLDQLLLFVLHEFLAVGVARVALARRDVGQLDDAAAVERDEEQIVLAHERHGRFAFGPARRGLSRRRARDVTARAGHGIDHHDVALIDEQHAAARTVPRAAHRRRVPPFLVGELPQVATIAAHDPRRRFIVAGTPPFEIQARRIARPAQSGLRIADELRAAHDAVDGQNRGVGPLLGADDRRGGNRDGGRRDRQREAGGDWHEILKERGGHYTIA